MKKAEVLPFYDIEFLITKIENMEKPNIINVNNETLDNSIQRLIKQGKINSNEVYNDTIRKDVLLKSFENKKYIFLHHMFTFHFFTYAWLRLLHYWFVEEEEASIYVFLVVNHETIDMLQNNKKVLSQFTNKILKTNFDKCRLTNSESFNLFNIKN